MLIYNAKVNIVRTIWYRLFGTDTWVRRFRTDNLVPTIWDGNWVPTIWDGNFTGLRPHLRI